MIETSRNQVLNSAIAGSASGLVVRFVISPLDVLKIRLQLERIILKDSNLVRTSSALQVISKIYKNEGILAFWKGNIPAEAMYLIYGATQFSSFLFFYKHVFHQLNDEVNLLLSGGFSGCAATVASYPFDTLRTRFAADNNKGFLKFWLSVSNIVANESIWSFYKGLKPTILQIFCQTGLSFWLYNYLKKFQLKLKDRSDASDSSSFATSMVIPISGFLAGVFAKFVTFPLDSIKRRLQISNSQHLLDQNTYQYLDRSKKVYQSEKIIKIVSNIIKNEKILSLYKGFGISILKSGPAAALSFTIYEFVMNILN